MWFPFSCHQHEQGVENGGFRQRYEKICTLFEINPFVPNAPFLYALKISENLTVSWWFQKVEKGCIGKKWVKGLFFMKIYHIEPHWPRVVLKKRLLILKISPYPKYIGLQPATLLKRESNTIGSEKISQQIELRKLECCIQKRDKCVSLLRNAKKKYCGWEKTLHKRWSFPLRISSENCGFGHIYWRNP